MLTREQILEAEDRKVVEVDVPEWGGSVGIIVMSGKDRDSYESELLNRRDKNGEISEVKGLRSSLLSKGLVDEEGKALFDSKTITKLEDKNAAVLDRLFRKAMEVNAIDDGSMEEAEKN